MTWKDYIDQRPDVMVGKPIIKGTRLTVQQILLDFGELIFRYRLITTGIILLRIRAANENQRLSIFQTWWPGIEAQGPGFFLTVSNDRLRIRELPDSGSSL